MFYLVSGRVLSLFSSIVTLASVIYFVDEIELNCSLTNTTLQYDLCCYILYQVVYAVQSQ